MKIIILGTNQVATTLAETLANEKNDITLIDKDIERLRELQNRFDIRTVRGIGSHPDILAQAQAASTDMLIAVTDSDEINMLACQIAANIFHIPQKIARIRSTSYLSYPELFNAENIPVDLCISPEQSVARYVTRLIERPGSLQVVDFSDGQIQLIVIKVKVSDKLAGTSLHDAELLIKEFNAHIAVIYRKNAFIQLDATIVFEKNDEVFFIADKTQVNDVMQAFNHKEHRYKNIMIAGGGMIGFTVAHYLENTCHVKVIEKDKDRARYLSTHLEKSMVFLGDATDRELLRQENIDKMDVFCALTNDDEDNIMSCLQAKKLGVPNVLALVTRSAYADLIEGGDIDIVVSPQHATISSILSHVRQGDIVNVHSLRRGAVEAIEIIVHGDQKNSHVVGKTIASLKFPLGTTLGVIVRNEKLLIPYHDTIIASEDHLIIFLTDKSRIRELEKLFQVRVNFI